MPYFCPEACKVSKILSRVDVLIAISFSLVECSNDQRPDLFDICAILIQQLFLGEHSNDLISLRVLFFVFLPGLVDEKRPQFIRQVVIERFLLLQFLDGVEQLLDFFVLMPHTGKPPLIPLQQLCRIEQEVIDVSHLLFIDLFLGHSPCSFRHFLDTQRRCNVLPQVDVIHPLQFLKVIHNTRVHLLYAVHQHKDSNLIRTDVLPCDQVGYILSNTSKSTLEHLLILTVHTHANSQLNAIPFLHKCEDVVLTLEFQICELGVQRDLLDVLQFVLVIEYAFLDGDLQSCRQGGRFQMGVVEGKLSLVGLKMDLDGFQEATMRYVLVFYLGTCVSDQSIGLV